MNRIKGAKHTTRRNYILGDVSVTTTNSTAPEIAQPWVEREKGGENNEKRDGRLSRFRRKADAETASQQRA